MFGNTRKLIV